MTMRGTVPDLVQGTITVPLYTCTRAVHLYISTVAHLHICTPTHACVETVAFVYIYYRAYFQSMQQK